jgi:hypothetical protein
MSGYTFALLGAAFEANMEPDWNSDRKIVPLSMEGRV